MVEKWIELSFERLLSDAIPGRQKTDHGGDDDSRWHFGGLYCERGPKTDRTANCDSRDHAIRLGMDRALACIEAMASKTGTPAETSPLIAPSGLPDLGPIWMSPELSEFVRLAPLGIVIVKAFAIGKPGETRPALKLDFERYGLHFNSF